MLFIFLKGCLIGLFIAIPVGPVGVLCMRRTLSAGKWSGLFSGLGASSVDALYAIIAGLGAGFVADAFMDYHRWLAAIGGSVLMILGVKALRAKPVNIDESHLTKKRLFGDYLSTMMLTFTNPTPILSMVALYAAMGLDDLLSNRVRVVAMALGVFVGSATWWVVLSEVLGLLRQKNPQSLLIKINKVSGLILMIFGIVILVLSRFQRMNPT